jgi:hypothetical protein
MQSCWFTFPWCLTELPDELLEHIFDLLNIDGIDSISQADPKLSVLVQETGLYKKKD